MSLCREYQDAIALLVALVEVESAILRFSIDEHNHQDAKRQRQKSEDGA